MNEIWRIHMLTVGPAYVLMDELAETYDRLIGGSTVDAFKMTQGLAHASSVERDMYRLTGYARSAPAVAAGLADGTITTLEQLRATPGSKALSDALPTFLETYGNFGHSGEDMRDLHGPTTVTPTGGDRRRIATPAQDPDERHARLLAESDAVVQRARETLRERPEDLVVFEEVLAVARAVGRSPRSTTTGSTVRCNRTSVGCSASSAAWRMQADRARRGHLPPRVAEVIAALRDGQPPRDRR